MGFVHDGIFAVIWTYLLDLYLFASKLLIIAFNWLNYFLAIKHLYNVIFKFDQK
jgi:hypothetical protein